MANKSVPGTEITLSLEHVDKERDRLTLHWLPPTFSGEVVTAVVEAVSGDGQAVKIQALKLTYRTDYFIPRRKPTSTILHCS